MKKLLLPICMIFASTIIANANTYTVTNLNDSGEGSFRQAIIDANADADKDTIYFDAELYGTINIASDLPQIKTSMDIVGNVSYNILINADKKYECLIFDGSNVVANMSKIAIRNAKSDGIRIRNMATVTLDSISVALSERCGIFVRNANAIIKNSFSSYNQVDGILVFGQAIIERVVCDYNDNGILVHRNGNAVISNSTLSNNKSDGIMFDGNGIAVNITSADNLGNGISIYDGTDGMHGADVNATVYNSISYRNQGKDLYNVDGDVLNVYNTVYGSNDGGTTLTNCTTNNPYLSAFYQPQNNSSAINLADKKLINIHNLTQYAPVGGFIATNITEDYINNLLDYDQLLCHREFAGDKYDAGSITKVLHIPTLLLPENGAENISTTPTFKWNRVEEATSYTLMYYMQSNSGDPIYVHGITDTTYAISAENNGLFWDSTYFWEVWAVYENNPIIDRSEIWHFKVVAEPAPTLSKPILISPINNTEIADGSTTLVWHKVEGATKYIVEYSLENTFPFLTNIYPTKRIETADTTCTVKCLIELAGGGNESAEHYWHVKAINEDEVSEWSDIWMFKLEVSSIYEYFLINNAMTTPNPASDKADLHISMVKYSDIIINIYDISGSQVYSIASAYDIGNHIIALPLQNLANGSYVCQIVSNGKLIAATNMIVKK